MDIIKIEPADGGKKTELTIEMSAEEAELFKKALGEGKLAHLGLPKDAEVRFGVAHRGETDWAKSEDAKRTPKDRPNPTRRP